MDFKSITWVNINYWHSNFRSRWISSNTVSYTKTICLIFLTLFLFATSIFFRVHKTKISRTYGCRGGKTGLVFLVTTTIKITIIEVNRIWIKIIWINIRQQWPTCSWVYRIFSNFSTLVTSTTKNTTLYFICFQIRNITRASLTIWIRHHR